jgi:hypothetical protein
MTEQKRLQHNQNKLTECYPAFRSRVEAALKEMESQGFRPRISEAGRSPEDQLTAYKNGNSKLKFGFHNVTGKDAKPESLAVDVLMMITRLTRLPGIYLPSQLRQGSINSPPALRGDYRQNCAME